MFWLRVGHQRNLSNIWKVIVMKQPQFLCLGVWCRAPGTMVNHTCCYRSDHLIVDSQLLHFQPNLLLIFLCLRPSMYAAWCQMTPTSPKVTHYCEMREVRDRQVLVCLCGLHYLHGSSMSFESQFVHVSVSIQCSTNITPMTNTKFSLNTRYEDNSFVYTLPPDLATAWILIFITNFLFVTSSGSASLIVL